MAGRAGRTGLDETGEAIMIVPDGDELAKRHIFSVMQVRCILVKYTPWDWVIMTVASVPQDTHTFSHAVLLVVHHEAAAGYRQRRSGQVSAPTDCPLTCRQCICCDACACSLIEACVKPACSCCMQPAHPEFKK